MKQLPAKSGPYPKTGFTRAAHASMTASYAEANNLSSCPLLHQQAAQHTNCPHSTNCTAIYTPAVMLPRREQRASCDIASSPAASQTVLESVLGCSVRGCKLLDESSLLLDSAESPAANSNCSSLICPAPQHLPMQEVDVVEVVPAASNLKGGPSALHTLMPKLQHCTSTCTALTNGCSAASMASNPHASNTVFCCSLPTQSWSVVFEQARCSVENAASPLSMRAPCELSPTAAAGQFLLPPSDARPAAQAAAGLAHEHAKRTVGKHVVQVALRLTWVDDDCIDDSFAACTAQNEACLEGPALRLAADSDESSQHCGVERDGVAACPLVYFGAATAAKLPLDAQPCAGAATTRANSQSTGRSTSELPAVLANRSFSWSSSPRASSVRIPAPQQADLGQGVAAKWLAGGPDWGLSDSSTP